MRQSMPMPGAGDRRARPMIPLPLPAFAGTGATRIYLACGTTDMRKGFDGLAVLVQQALEASPHSGTLFAFRASGAIWSNCSGTMARDCACFPSGWTAAALSGRRRRRARSASPRRSFRCCWKALTGGGRSGPRHRYWRDKSRGFWRFTWCLDARSAIEFSCRNQPLAPSTRMPGSPSWKPLWRLATH